MNGVKSISPIAAYSPLPDDEDDLTPLQRLECHISTRRVSAMRYEAEMDLEKAEAVMVMPLFDLMDWLEIDEEQARDLRELAKGYLEHCDLAGVNAEGVA